MGKLEVISIGTERKVLLDGEDITDKLTNIEMRVDRYGLSAILRYRCIDASVIGDENTKVIHSCPVVGAVRKDEKMGDK